LLDWETPISGQSDKVKDALRSIGVDVDVHGNEQVRDVFQGINKYRTNADMKAVESDLKRALAVVNKKGATKEAWAEYERANKAYRAYKNAPNPHSGHLSEQETTQLLREAGIPGIQFRDHSSALHTKDYYADESTLPRNYSIFDENKIHIRSKQKFK
jgi:hypothetical protein